MQSVGPKAGRRQIRIRRSDDALLSRAIAVPPKKFAGLTLPGFGVMKRGPGGAALDRGGGTWRVMEASHAWTKTDAWALQFAVNVPADGETVVRYRVRVTY